MLKSSPFKRDTQLSPDHDTNQPWTLLGHPEVPLSDRKRIYQMAVRDIWSQELESISHRLWWMSKVDSSNISPLHRQVVKQREIIITEEPKLHLIWVENRIFIRPIPRYLLSFHFWDAFLNPDPLRPLLHPTTVQDLRSAALGFLRTYCHLIKYESDFRIAQRSDLLLIPQDVTWERFCSFSAQLRTIQDKDVSGRYHFGEIRLSRLNRYAPILLRRSQFYRVHRHYSQYFGRFYAPFLVTLSILSVMISAMQLAAAGVQISPTSGEDVFSKAWNQSVFIWSAVSNIIILGVFLTLFAFLWAWKTMREWRTAIADWKRFQRRLAQSQAGV